MALSVSLVVIFVLGYLAIAFEHPLKINKAASALLIGVLTWTVWMLFTHNTDEINKDLSHHFESTSQILFFLLGAMTIVELIDAHQGFRVITDRIKTTDARVLLWIISIITFFLSAALDNLTTSIVMVSLLRKLVGNKEQRKFYASMVIIAANAGGAWSPIGDVTTTMLWIGEQISAGNIMKTLFLPSLACMVAPLVVLSFRMKGNVSQKPESKKANDDVDGSRLIFFVGIVMLLFVPVFKTYTHLPPYVGMLFGLAIIWLVSELLHSGKDEEEKKPYTAGHALSRIDASSILFFLGILLAIASLEATGLLEHLALWMDNTLPGRDIIVIAIGLLSAVVDNVPLVAATMGMYPMASPDINVEAFNYAMAHPEIVHEGAFVAANGVTYFLSDAKIWEFIAYCAGTGGSCLIIGSAAGVAVMGMEKIDFIWYMKRITIWALIGYFAGIACYLVIYPMFAVH